MQEINDAELSGESCNAMYKPFNLDREQLEGSKRSMATGSLQCMVQIPDYVTQSNGQVPPWPFVADG
ncbi:hypothetical protein B9479_008362, partial [Cryptococcus floricola]